MNCPNCGVDHEVETAKRAPIDFQLGMFEAVAIMAITSSALENDVVPDYVKSVVTNGLAKMELAFLLSGFLESFNEHH